MYRNWRTYRLPLKQTAARFELTTAAGEKVLALHVVVAAGIVNFAYLPPQLASISGPMISHSSEHSDLTGFKGRRVAVWAPGLPPLILLRFSSKPAPRLNWWQEPSRSNSRIHPTSHAHYCGE